MKHLLLSLCIALSACASGPYDDPLIGTYYQALDGKLGPEAQAKAEAAKAKVDQLSVQQKQFEQFNRLGCTPEQSVYKRC